MTDEKIRAAVEIAQKAIDLAHRVPPEALRKSKELMTLAHAVVELSAELAALKEKYRWRNVDEEEPPRDTEVLVCCVSRSGAHKYVYTASFDGEDFYDRRGDSLSGEVKFWHPLDLRNLPEEDAE